jgi:hypothetical protein
MDLHTLADIRELVERHLPAECRERDTWRHVADRMSEAARGGNIEDAVLMLRLVRSSRCRACRSEPTALGLLRSG